MTTRRDPIGRWCALGPVGRGAGRVGAIGAVWLSLGVGPLAAQTSEIVPAVDVPPPLDVPYPQILDPEREIPGSQSVGTTSDGRLRGSVELAVEGPGYYVLLEHRGRDTHWGTAELVRLIEHAGERYAITAESRFGVGNLSARGGGDISWSRSHNAGRDADIALPMLDEEGEVMETPALIPLRRDGLARDRSGRRLDVRRAWMLVEAFVASDEAQLQWLFLYEPLKVAILDHARSIGADPELLDRAGEILHQPGDSAPHDDHLHVRVFCARDDLLDGCENWGPAREHADLFADEVETRTLELLRGASDPDPATATAAVAQIDALLGSRAAPRLAAAIASMSPPGQLAALGLIAEYDERGTGSPAVALLESSPDGHVRLEAARVLGRLADLATGPALAALAARGGAPLADGTPLRRAAALAHRNIWTAESLDALITALDDPELETRAAVARVLARVTGHTDPADPAVALTDTERAALIARWQVWRDAEGGRGQDLWYAGALRAAGYRIASWGDAPIAELVRAVRDDRDAIRFIADRALVTRGYGWTPSEGWTIARRHAYWVRQTGSR